MTGTTRDVRIFVFLRLTLAQKDKTAVLEVLLAIVCHGERDDGSQSGEGESGELDHDDGLGLLVGGGWFELAWSSSELCN